MPPPSNTHDACTNCQPTFVIPTTSSCVFQTVNHAVCINPFSCPTNKIVTKILTLLRPHVVIAPTTDPIITLTHILVNYGTLQHLLYLQITIFIHSQCQLSM